MQERLKGLLGDLKRAGKDMDSLEENAYQIDIALWEKIKAASGALREATDRIEVAAHGDTYQQ